MAKETHNEAIANFNTAANESDIKSLWKLSKYFGGRPCHKIGSSLDLLIHISHLSYCLRFENGTNYST